MVVARGDFLSDNQEQIVVVSLLMVLAGIQAKMVRHNGKMKPGLDGGFQDVIEGDSGVVRIGGMEVDGSGVIKHER